MVLELRQLSESVGVPDPDRPVVRPAHNAGAVGRHRNGSHIILMALEVGQLPEGADGPDPYRLVVRPGDDAGAIGRHRNGQDRILMPLEDSKLSYRAERVVEISGSERPGRSAL